MFSKSAMESLNLALERNLVFNKTAQQQSGHRGSCLRSLEEDKSVCDSLLVIVVKSVRGAFSG